MTSGIEIGKRCIGPGNPVYCIAEVSANHHQDFAQAVRIIEAAKQAGADAVKLQTYTADTMTIVSNRQEFRIAGGTLWDGRNLHDLYGEAYTPWEWQPKLKKLAEDLGMDLFSTAFDSTAVDFLEEHGRAGSQGRFVRIGGYSSHPAHGAHRQAANYVYGYGFGGGDRGGIAKRS